jgi:hypothetical protein
VEGSGRRDEAVAESELSPLVSKMQNLLAHRACPIGVGGGRMMNFVTWVLTVLAVIVGDFLYFLIAGALK